MATGVVRGSRPAAATRRLTFRQRHQWEKKNGMILPSDDDEALEIVASHIEVKEEELARKTDQMLQPDVIYDSEDSGPHVEEIEKAAKLAQYTVDKHVAIIGEVGFGGYTRFPLDEFNEICAHIEDFARARDTLRGRRSPIDTRGRLALELHILAHNPTFTSMTTDLMTWCCMSERKLHGIHHGTIRLLSEYAKTEALPKDPRQVLPSTREFHFFPQINFVLDGENSPIQRVGKGGAGFKSGNKGWSTKVVSVHNAAGRVAWLSETYPGAPHDFKVTKEGKGFTNGLTIAESFNYGRGQCDPIMGDGGFQGIDKLVKGSIVPRRRVDGQLSPDDAVYNEQFAHDRIIVENFYARKKGLWRITRDTFRGDPGLMKFIIPVTFWLTDLSVQWHPLRSDAIVAEDEEV
jgi:hypothetical protein